MTWNIHGLVDGPLLSWTPCSLLYLYVELERIIYFDYHFLTILLFANYRLIIFIIRKFDVLACVRRSHFSTDKQFVEISEALISYFWIGFCCVTSVIDFVGVFMSSVILVGFNQPAKSPVPFSMRYLIWSPVIK